MKDFLVTIYTRSYQQTGIITACSEEDLYSFIFETGLFYINNERPRSYMVHEN